MNSGEAGLEDMNYNEKGIDRFVKTMGMRAEFNHLQGAGLSYSQFSEVLDGIFNPGSEKRIEGVSSRVLKSDYDLPSTMYEFFQKYFGIGVDETYTFTRISQEADKPLCWARRSSERLKQLVKDKGILSNILKREIFYRSLEEVYRPLEKVCSS